MDAANDVEIYVVQGLSGLIFLVTVDCAAADEYAKTLRNGHKFSCWKKGKLIYQDVQVEVPTP